GSKSDSSKSDGPKFKGSKSGKSFGSGKSKRSNITDRYRKDYKDRDEAPARQHYPQKQKEVSHIPADVKSADGKVRLNKFLADSGIASRRKADEIIAEGEITINGKKVYELGVRIDPNVDRVLYKGKPVRTQNRFVYYVFNKPRSVVTTTSDPFGRPTVLDYFPKETLRIFPVGRLDWDAEGLILLTNDGEFSHKVIHPEKGVLKTYFVKLDGVPTDHHLDKLRKGVSIEGGGKVAAQHVRKLGQKGSDKKAWIEITIREGKNHQIKKMFQKINFDVIKLRRMAIGGLKLGALKSGEHRELTPDDFLRIFKKPKIEPIDDDSVPV
ncbi:MAG: rRNA pseudouridine synthase, partial [Bdellovibrionaceae bacterium]|nr:rRNA pseudouridine synthase [Pseudobdellovibrionaceae bacterium]